MFNDIPDIPAKKFQNLGTIFQRVVVVLRNF